MTISKPNQILLYSYSYIFLDTAMQDRIIPVLIPGIFWGEFPPPESLNPLQKIWKEAITSS